MEHGATPALKLRREIGTGHRAQGKKRVQHRELNADRNVQNVDWKLICENLKEIF